jgi:hypothetical protein
LYFGTSNKVRRTPAPKPLWVSGRTDIPVDKKHFGRQKTFRTLDFRHADKMTIGKKIWGSTNKVLTTINLMLFALFASGGTTPTKVKDADETKIPLVYNIILLIVLLTIISFLFYIFIGRPVSGA